MTTRIFFRVTFPGQFEEVTESICSYEFIDSIRLWIKNNYEGSRYICVREHPEGSKLHWHIYLESSEVFTVDSMRKRFLRQFKYDNKASRFCSFEVAKQDIDNIFIYLSKGYKAKEVYNEENKPTGWYDKATKKPFNTEILECGDIPNNWIEFNTFDRKITITDYNTFWSKKGRNLEVDPGAYDASKKKKREWIDEICLELEDYVKSKALPDPLDTNGNVDVSYVASEDEAGVITMTEVIYFICEKLGNTYKKKFAKTLVQEIANMFLFRYPHYIQNSQYWKEKFVRSVVQLYAN